ncbi:MAG: hypothetical protein L0210_09200 [Rhodospirillales bacterium]|nr:hypothetical protein [Rhodospirillales bacterium]
MDLFQRYQTTRHAIAAFSRSDASAFDIAQVLERFPRNAALVARLLVENETFRSVCEDYALARATLEQLEELKQVKQGAEVADYRSLVAELEKEIAEALRNARQSQ